MFLLNNKDTTDIHKTAWKGYAFLLNTVQNEMRFEVFSWL